MRQRPGLPPYALVANQRGGEAQEFHGIVDAALDQVAPQAVPRVRRQAGERRQFGVRLVVARQEGQPDAALAADGGNLLHAVGPVAATAEQPHDDQSRPRQRVLDV